MKSRQIGIALLSMILCSFSAYAADGDLIVNGKIGVGTTSPQTSLQVNGDITLGDTTAGAKGIHTGTSDGADVSWLGLSGGGAIFNAGRGAFIDLFGNEVVGSNGGAWRMLNGAAILSGGLADSGGYGGGIYFQTNSATRMFISFGGNVGIGTETPGSYKLYVAGNAYTTGTWGASDGRYKENIKPIDTPLAKILKINGILYNWKTAEYKDKGFPEGKHYGVIAQEIEKVIPEVVQTSASGEKSVAYTEIIPVLIEAVKEQQKIIDEQNKKIEALTHKMGKRKQPVKKP